MNRPALITTLVEQFRIVGTNVWQSRIESDVFAVVQCNKIMEVKQVDDVVVTHGDCEDVFVWHFERQAQANAQNKVRLPFFQSGFLPGKVVGRDIENLKS